MYTCEYNLITYFNYYIEKNGKLITIRECTRDEP